MHRVLAIVVAGSYHALLAQQHLDHAQSLFPIVPRTGQEQPRLRTLIEKSDGAFIAEGAPQRVNLAYPMAVWNNGSWTKYNDAYFGWLKFELDAAKITLLEDACKADKEILRHLIIKTVREDTRANVRQFVLKEVKRTDTIKTIAKVKPVAEVKEEVSDEKLDEAIEELVAD